MTEPLSGVIVQPGSGPSAVELAPRPLLRTVGDIAGLSPRHQRGDGGEVPAAWVNRVDAMPEPEWNVAAAWLSAQKQASTRRTYLADLYAYLSWCDANLTGLSLFDATEDVLVSYRDSLGTLAAATVARRVSTLSSLFGYARHRKVMATNPAADVRRPDVGDEGTTPALSEDEAESLAGGCESIATEHPYDAACVALILYDGIRVGEAVGLDVGSVGWSSGHCVLTVVRKGGKVGTLPIPPRACELLNPILAGRNPGDPLFVDDAGNRWDRFRVWTAIRRAARAAGIAPSKLTPHVLRTTAATILLDNGVPLRDVQDLLGHKRPETTRRYDRGGKRLDGHAVYRLASILGGGS